jgi:hypothetical protein
MGPSTALIATPATTDVNGNFNITGDYTCPTPSTLVYIVATGGNPGLNGTVSPGQSGAVNNNALALMSVLGTCGSLGGSTYIVVNELTTVAAIEALAPYMADYAHLGSSSSSALAGAFATAAALVNFSTGQLQPAPTGVIQPIPLLNTLANILAACVNTAGGTPGDGSACGNLLQDTANGVTTNTILAMLHISQLPAQNVASLFTLSTAVPPFQPALTSAPADLSLPIGISLPLLINSASDTGAYLLAIDTAQHIWVYSQADQLVGGVYQYVTGTITIYDNSGNLLTTISPSTGGLDLPFQLAADPFGNVWALNSNLTLSKFGPTGAALSPAGGFPIPYLPSTGLPTSIPLGGLFSYMAIDPSGNVWGIGSGASSNCFIEISNSGAVITPTGNFCATANGYYIEAATDTSGNAWFLGQNSVSKVSSSGSFVTSGVNSNGCFALTNPYTTYNLTYDWTNNRLWGIGADSLGALNADGTQAFCYTGTTNLPVFIQATLPTTGLTRTAGVVAIESGALDGAGNLWFTTSGELTTGFYPTVNATTATSASTTSVGGLNEIGASGNLITPFNASASVFGLQPVSTFVQSFTVLNGGNPLTVNVYSQGSGGQNLAIDAYGNIWSTFGTFLIKTPGLAAPKSHQ